MELHIYIIELELDRYVVRTNRTRNIVMYVMMCVVLFVFFQIQKSCQRLAANSCSAHVYEYHKTRTIVWTLSIFW